MNKERPPRRQNLNLWFCIPVGGLLSSLEILKGNLCGYKKLLPLRPAAAGKKVSAIISSYDTDIAEFRPP